MKTGRQVQRAFFLESLRRQFDDISEGLRKDELYAAAEEYVRDGFDEKEALELLTIDGFDPVMSAACLDRISKTASEGSESSWGFELEDDRGDILTSFDLQRVVVASSEAEAWEKAETLAGENPGGNCRVVRVFRT